MEVCCEGYICLCSQAVSKVRPKEGQSEVVEVAGEGGKACESTLRRAVVQGFRNCVGVVSKDSTEDGAD